MKFPTHMVVTWWHRFVKLTWSDTMRYPKKSIFSVYALNHPNFRWSSEKLRWILRKIFECDLILQFVWFQLNNFKGVVDSLGRIGNWSTDKTPLVNYGISLSNTVYRFCAAIKEKKNRWHINYPFERSFCENK
jgi:hypothetical protein